MVPSTKSLQNASSPSWTASPKGTNPTPSGSAIPSDHHSSISYVTTSILIRKTHAAGQWYESYIGRECLWDGKSSRRKTGEGHFRRPPLPPPPRPRPPPVPSLRPLPPPRPKPLPTFFSPEVFSLSTLFRPLLSEPSWFVSLSVSFCIILSIPKVSPFNSLSDGNSLYCEASGLIPRRLRR